MPVSKEELINEINRLNEQLKIMEKNESIISKYSRKYEGKFVRYKSTDDERRLSISRIDNVKSVSDSKDGDKIINCLTTHVNYSKDLDIHVTFYHNCYFHTNEIEIIEDFEAYEVGMEMVKKFKDMIFEIFGIKQE